MSTQPPRDVRSIRRKSRTRIPLLAEEVTPPNGGKSVDGVADGVGLTEALAAKALADLAQLMSSATTLADAQKTQLTVLHALLSPKSCFIAEYQPVRKQLLVTAVRGRNDDRITVSTP